MGLCLVSKNILPKYSPIIPSDNNCTPPKNRMTIMRVGNPCKGSPKMIVFMNIKHIYRKAENETMIPNNVDILKGAVE